MEILDQPGTSELKKAENGNRIVAMIIDWVVAGALWLVPIVGWFASIIYLFIRDGLPFLDGQSIGKKAMGLRAVTEDGQALTNNWGANIMRNITVVISPLSLIELIVLLSSDNGLRLGDQWAKTKVIAVK